MLGAAAATAMRKARGLESVHDLVRELDLIRRD
jgi:hypothetical protein